MKKRDFVMMIEVLMFVHENQPCYAFDVAYGLDMEPRTAKVALLRAWRRGRLRRTNVKRNLGMWSGYVYSLSRAGYDKLMWVAGGGIPTSVRQVPRNV